jgi:hypothetical protein
MARPHMLFDIVRKRTMERTVALNKLRRLLGKEYGYRINPKAPTQEERAAAREAVPAARELHKELAAKKQARLEALLIGDAKYQELAKQTREAQKNREYLECNMRGCKITVGKSVAGLFFSVQAEGDSWEEVIAKLTKVAA